MSGRIIQAAKKNAVRMVTKDAARRFENDNRRSKGLQYAKVWLNKEESRKDYRNSRIFVYCICLWNFHCKWAGLLLKQEVMKIFCGFCLGPLQVGWYWCFCALEPLYQPSASRSGQSYVFVLTSSNKCKIITSSIEDLSHSYASKNWMFSRGNLSMRRQVEDT